MDGTEATKRLFAEVIALRIVAQRLTIQLGLVHGDVLGFVAHEHEAALQAIQSYELNDTNPERAAAIRELAGAVIDQIYGGIHMKRDGG